MTRRPSSPDLTPEAARYLDGMRSLRPPVDLVEHVMVEVEATPQERLGFAGCLGLGCSPASRRWQPRFLQLP